MHELYGFGNTYVTDPVFVDDTENFADYLEVLLMVLDVFYKNVNQLVLKVFWTSTLGNGLLNDTIQAVHTYGEEAGHQKFHMIW